MKYFLIGMLFIFIGLLAILFYVPPVVAEVTVPDREFVVCANEVTAMIADKTYPAHMETDTRLLVEYASYAVIMCQLEYLPAKQYFNPRPMVYKIIRLTRNKEL